MDRRESSPLAEGRGGDVRSLVSARLSGKLMFHGTRNVTSAIIIVRNNAGAALAGLLSARHAAAI